MAVSAVSLMGFGKRIIRIECDTGDDKIVIRKLKEIGIEVDEREYDR